MEPQTLNDIFLSIAERNSAIVMMGREAAGWVPISAQELYRGVLATASALARWGVVQGDRVAILSENRPEWTIADFACLLLGAVTVPVYCTLTAEQTAYILRDSGARAIFVSSDQHLQKVLSIFTQTDLEKIIVMDLVENSRAAYMHDLMQAGPEGRDLELETQARKIKPDDLATIVYTSGTTGTSKGAMLTHGNMTSNLICSLLGFEIKPGEVSVSFLPLSHITARHVDFAMLRLGVTLAYVPFIDQLPQTFLEVHPSILVAVPRVLEKIHAQADLKTKGFPKHWIYRWALSVGKAHREETLAGRVPDSLEWKIANRLVFSQIRAGLGGKVRLFISGGAPLGRELAEWYAAVGIRIHEGYGLTETSPVIAVNTPIAHKIGTVGKPLPNIEVRIAEDGEILVRGPSVFKAYWGKPEETSAAFIDDWFKTGDIGKLDSDGFLSVTDRKKDLIKTSGGKFIAPQPIENSLKHNPLVAEAVVLGDRRKFPAVLIAPYFPLLEDWARQNQIVFASRNELVENDRVRALYDGVVNDVNQNLARFEKLKRVLLVAEEFSSENGTLTASMKMRRRAVEERFREQIDALYTEAELATPVAE
jgi:long-chain acyl-CoA synthetase